MIQVESYNGKLTIFSTVTDFCEAMGYCEYKIPLSLQGIKPPPTEATIQGGKAHERQEKYEKEHFELVPISSGELADIKKDVEFAYEAINTRLFVSSVFGEANKTCMFIFGRADKIYRSKGTLIVEESKFPLDPTRYLNVYEPFPDQKLQTLLYLNSLFSIDTSFDSKTWFSIPHEKKAWIINIKDRNNGETITSFRGLQTPGLEEFMRKCIQRFALIAVGKLEPKHHQKRAKCVKCRMENCRHKLGP